MKFTSKKGSTIVEASMIFPLVIAGVIAVLYIIIGVFCSLSLQCSIHMALKNETGQITETIIRNQETHEYEMEQALVGIHPIISIEEYKEYEISKLFTNKIERIEKGRSYIIDEAELIRRVTLAKEVLFE